MTNSTYDNQVKEGGLNIISEEIKFDSFGKTNYLEEAEKANARWAMIGFVALLGAYITTGQIIPGIF